MTETRSVFPALRCKMGERYYYVTYLTFADVAKWIKKTEEVHTSKKLSDWIQRTLDDEHAGRIAKYLRTSPDRFFNAIVVGVYRGEPAWDPIEVSPPKRRGLELIEADVEHLQSSLGVLVFNGDERLFAIDGQHRVAGIKAAIADGRDGLANDEIAVVFVGHRTNAKGMASTRKLFVTLNKTARRVSDRARRPMPSKKEAL